MGFVAGERVPWKRWWFLPGAEVATHDGILLDPSDEYARYLNPAASRLADHDAHRAIVLLADGGMGKSFELEAEIERRQSTGQHVARLDLGEYVTVTEVQTAVREAVDVWKDTRAEELTFAFDSFDESLFDINNLNNVLRRELQRLDRSHLRVLIASRSSLWRGTLADAFVSWWGDAVITLALGPLTEGDIRVAASTDVADVDVFIQAVNAAGAGPLAALPVTLRLLLRIFGTDDMPSRRVDAYRLGVGGLVTENAPRRQERRREGAALELRLGAAKRLAAATLLAGRPRILRRRRPLDTGHEVALDQVTTGEVSLDTLDDVFDSALLAGHGEARTWVHRSIEEYLCAEQLSELPLATAASLLSDPSDPSKLLPQLADTAGWFAAQSTETFEWVLEQDYAILMNADFRSRNQDERRFVGQELLARLADGEVATDRSAYDALGYEGFADDLKPFLAPTEPTWRRREAARIVADTGLRDLDDELVSLVEGVAAEQPDYNDEVQLAVWATIALRNCNEPVLLDRLRSVATDNRTPDLLRAELLGNLWPRHMSTAELQATVESAEHDGPPDGLHERLAHILMAAVRSSAVRPADLLSWLTAWPEATLHGRDLDNLTAMAVRDIVTTFSAGTEQWREAVGFIRQRLRSTGRLFDWSIEDVDRLGDERRRFIARDALMGRRDEVDISHFRRVGIIQAPDLAWWLIELARKLKSDSAAALSARAVVEHLAWVVPDAEASATVDSAVAEYSVLKVAASEIFGREAVRRRVDARAAEESSRAEQAARSAPRTFSGDRLNDALAANDFITALLEMERPAPADMRPGGATGRVASGSQVLDEEQTRRTSEATLSYLQQESLNLDDWDTIGYVIKALKFLLEQNTSTVESIPSTRWFQWLPKVLAAPDGYLVANTVLMRAASAEPEGTEQALIAQMRREAENNRVIIPHLIRNYQSRKLSADAIELASTASVDPIALIGLLEVAETALPLEAASAALKHIRGRIPLASEPTTEDSSPRKAQAITSWQRAVNAATALTRMERLPTVWGDLLDEFRRDNGFALDVVRAVDRSSGSRPWHALSAAQLAEFYLWARDNMPPERSVEPGVPVRVDPAEELPGEIIRQLMQLADTDAAEALRGISNVTDDVWIRHAARTTGDRARAEQWHPQSPTAVMQIIDDPKRRSITTADQLAEVVLTVLDDLARGLKNDRALRAQLWHRQRQRNEWKGYVPLTELELSDWLSREFKRQIGRRVAVFREVEIQPHLADTEADIPDLLAVSVTTAEKSVELPVEIKCNWHRDVRTAIKDQLGNRYLRGPHGTTGIYIVGCYSGNYWRDDDSRQARARGRNYSSLLQDLNHQSQDLANRGITAHVYVLDLRLDEDL